MTLFLGTLMWIPVSCRLMLALLVTASTASAAQSSELFSNLTFLLAEYRTPVRLAGLRGRLPAGAGARSDWADVDLDRHVRRQLLNAVSMRACTSATASSGCGRSST